MTSELRAKAFTAWNHRHPAETVVPLADAEAALAECEQQRDALVGMDHLAEHYRKERDDAEQKLQQFAADTVEGMDCLSTCDSTAHDELCPVAHPVEAWRVLRERLAACEREKGAISEAARAILDDEMSDCRKSLADRLLAALTEAGEQEKK